MNELYLSVGIPIIGILIAILVNVTWFSFLSNRLQKVETRLDGRIDRLEDRIDRFEVKFESRMDRLESAIISKMDILTGKVIEIDNRLTRVEEQLKHLH
jgi:hypothetical protein